MGEEILIFTDSEFSEKVLKADKPTLVDFWAEWCAPCRALAPVVENVAKSYGDRLQVGKLNIDENPQVPNQYGVRAIPTLILFKGGRMVDQLVGLVNKDKLKEFIDKSL